MTQPAKDKVGQSAAPPAARPKWWHIRWGIFRYLAVLYLLICVALMIIEENLIFFPAAHPAGNWKPPALAFEDAWFEAADGTKLHGWYLPHESPRAHVLFAPGNAGNLTYRTDRLRHLHGTLQTAVLIFDYRGYGKSQGKPDEPGILSDARAARHWLAERAKIDEKAIVLIGESLGGGVMVDLASRDGARGLVLENTFTSLPDVAAYHYPAFPVKLLMKNRLASIEKIKNYHGPLLVCHGAADQTVPYELGRRLFDAANDPKEFVKMAGHDHNDPLPDEYYQALDAFVGKLP